MTPKLSKQFDTLEEDLRLCDLGGFADRVQALKVALTPKPRAVAPKAKSFALKLEITENGKTSEVVFDDEKKAEAFLKLKHKSRIASARDPKGLSVPIVPMRKDQIEEYNEKCTEYRQAAHEQNLTFSVKISKA